MSHTPEPWIWGKNWTTEAFGDPNDEETGMKYADLTLSSGPHAVIPIRIDHYKVIVDHDGTPEGTIREADRLLIAAAPELLALCKKAKRLSSNLEFLDELSAVIQKAGGAQ